jgi:acyl carrier protein
MQIERMIREYLNENVLFGDAIQYDDDASFLAAGILDSIAVLGLVSWIESTFGFAAAVRDITPENFDSINRLAAYIRASMPSRAGAGEEDARTAPLPLGPALAPQS